MTLKTFWFNLFWEDGSKCERFCVAIAPDRETALRLCAYEILSEGDLDTDDLHEYYTGLIHWVEENFTILSEGGDIGHACPNCTSHNTVGPDSVTGHHSCQNCGYEFMTLGFGIVRLSLEASALATMAKLDEAEKEWFNPFN